MTPEIKRLIEEAAKDRFKHVDAMSETEGTFDFIAGAEFAWAWASTEIKAENADFVKQARIHAEEMAMQQEQLKTLQAERDLFESSMHVAQKENFLLRKQLKILRKALDWYWANWGTNDRELKLKGYKLSSEALAKVDAMTASHEERR